MTDKQVPHPQRIGVPVVESRASVLGEESNGVKVVTNYRHSPDWYEDALHESCTKGNHNSRRREIVFAVSCAESYLVDWVIAEVLKHKNFERVDEFFVPGEKIGAADKWKEIPKRLVAAHLIPASLDCSQKFWQEWKELCEWRNGLIHAKANRPLFENQPKGDGPFPTKAELDNLKAGWAVEVVYSLILELHKTVGTNPPAWLKAPESNTQD